MPAAILLLLLQSSPVGQILDNVREATGFKDLATSVYYLANGKGSFQGVESQVTFAFGLQGEYVLATDGPLGQARGFDGTKGWETDSTGAPSALELSDLQHQHAISWFLDHEWLDPTGSIEVTSATADQGGDSYTLNLRQKNTAHVQKVVVDRATWLPKQTSFVVNGLDIVYEIKDWTQSNGAKLPQHIETLEGGIKGWIKFDQFEPRTTADFVRPQWSLSQDTVWEGEGSTVLDTKRTRTGHILVKPTVAGKDVGWFILDSGAGGMAMDETAVEELGAEKFGQINVGGVGGMLESSYVKVNDFKLGDMTIKSLNFVAIDLKMVSLVFGVKIGGIVGFEFFRRATTEIDLESGNVSIHDPRKFERKDADWQLLVLDGRHPTFVCGFEGDNSGRFRLDTGANGTVTFNTPTVLRHNLLEGREVTTQSSAGVGGSVMVKSGTIKYFELAGTRFDDIDAAFATEEKGVFGEDYLAGNIGQDLLKSFTLILDYANERIALVSKS